MTYITMSNAAEDILGPVGFQSQHRVGDPITHDAPVEEPLRNLAGAGAKGMHPRFIVQERDEGGGKIGRRIARGYHADVVITHHRGRLRTRRDHQRTTAAAESNSFTGRATSR